MANKKQSGFARRAAKVRGVTQGRPTMTSVSMTLREPANGIADSDEHAVVTATEARSKRSSKKPAKQSARKSVARRDAALKRKAEVEATRAIREGGLAGGMPQPGAAVAASSPRLPKVYQAIAHLVAAHEVEGALLPGPEFDVAGTETARCYARLEKLAVEALNDDVVLAVIARWMFHDADGRMPQLEDEDPAQRAAARLIEAVLRRNGMDTTKGVSFPIDLTAAQDIADLSGPAAATAGDDAGHADRLPPELGLALDEMLRKARQGVTTLRTVVTGWERQHGPHRRFEEDDCAFLASLEYCADGIEATISMISDRIDDAIEGRRSPG